MDRALLSMLAGGMMIASSSAFAQATPQPAPVAGGPPRGIYVDTVLVPQSSADETAVDHALSKPGVDGLVIVVGWDTLQPAKEHGYNFDVLDHWIIRRSVMARHSRFLCAQTKPPVG